jgi:type IV pilus assembly protein PilW
MKLPSRGPRSARAQHGLTLVELLVGLALGLIVTAALLLVFAQASIAGQNLNRSSVQIETGRYISELLTEDLRLAGFYGEAPIANATYAAPAPCGTDPSPAASPTWASAPFVLPMPIQGYGSGVLLGCLSDRLAGTDALAMRRVSSETTAVAALGSGNAQHYVQYSYCEQDPVATKLVFGTAQAGFTLRNRACTQANPLRAYVSHLYFVARCNRCGNGGDSTPTLKRVDLTDGALVETAIAEGVEALRFEYGFDVDGNGSADKYLTAEAAAASAENWANAVAVKAHFITRSLQKVSGSSGLATAQSFELGSTGPVNFAADGYTRRAYTTVIRLINPSGAREIQ